MYDGISFTDVKAEINVHSGVYAYVDNPEKNKVYYRIKYIENTGKLSYSNIIFLNGNGKSNINVYPNPFLDDISIRLSQPSAKNVVIELLDMSGKKIYLKEYLNFAGELLNVNIKNINIASWS